MARLFDLYRNELIPQLRQLTGRTNVNSLPRLQKMVISMGLGRAATQGEKDRIDEAVKHLTMLAGQKAVVTTAKKSVSGFRLRQGMKVGAKVTLRGLRMYEFLDRLITIALPRVRDFRGVNGKSFDGQGNYSLGITEQSIFPEIELDKMKYNQGMNVTVVIDHSNDKESFELLKMFGMPFKKN
jgi:large subunit ribosomal protein L5